MPVPGGWGMGDGGWGWGQGRNKQGEKAWRRYVNEGREGVPDGESRRRVKARERMLLLNMDILGLYDPLLYPYSAIWILICS